MAPSRQHIVPNPFRSRTGKTKAGEVHLQKRRAGKEQEVFGDRIRFPGLRVDQQFSLEESLDHQARLHWHLANEYPLCLLVYCGSNPSMAGTRPVAPGS